MPAFLVTGGCGFIGSHLATALRDDGHGVRVLDDLSSGHRGNLPSGIELIVGDIRDAARVREAVDGVDGCFHLAAIASVERGVRDWAGTHAVNQLGTINLLDAMRARGTPFVYASSAAVYGDGPSGPIAEDGPRSPLSAYGADKLGCELHARVAHEVFGIPSVGLRFFNVYGARQDPASPYSGVISVFCDRLLRGEPLTIFGDGQQTRDFIAVVDVVAALRAAMARMSAGAATYNVCTGNAASIEALARTIAELAGVDADIRYGPPRSGEIRHSVGVPARSREMLGLGEPLTLRQGLPAVLKWLGTPA